MVESVKKVAIYARVSTESQTYDQQVETCKNYCKIKDWNDYQIFTEVESSKNYRPVFEDILKRLRNHEFNCLLVFRIDRAWRSSRQFIMDFDNLKSRGIFIVSVMEGLDPSTTMGEAMMTIIVVLAELERKMIAEATKQRLDALKKLGKVLGRPKGSKDKDERAKSSYYTGWQKRKEKYGKGGMKKGGLQNTDDATDKQMVGE